MADPLSQAHDIWREIQESCSYEGIVERSNDWFSIVWDNTKKLHLCPKGKRVFDRCPRIFISSHIGNLEGEYSLGSYYTYQAYHGPAIRIAPAKRMLYCRLPMFYTLRETIVHEAQHAIDESYGVWSGEHNHWFDKRVERFIKIFPPSLL